MKQTQGNWDPGMRGVYFTAGDLGRIQEPELFAAANRYHPQVANLFAVNDFAEMSKEINRGSPSFQQFVLSIERGCPTFLDSGIFFLTNQHKRAHGTTMDEALALAPEEIDGFDWLWDVYVELCSEFGDRLWGYNELDQGGMANKIRTRARIEAEGLAPIPVYHPLNDGWDYFDDLARGYDRMCFGNLVQASRTVRKRLLVTALERHRAYPDLFIHFLGLTPNEIQAGLPFDSTDSSTWTAAFRYPQAVRFNAMAAKAFAATPGSWLPLASDDITESRMLRMRAGDMSIQEALAVRRNLAHWQDEVLSTFAIERYPTP